MEDRIQQTFLIGARKREKVLVSACLLGTACRYDGKSKICDAVIKLEKYFDFIPVCPETMGGLKTPRDPSEIVEEKVLSKKGRDVTQNYRDGAYWAMAVCRVKGVRLAILKANSPSCGVHQIHDGTFSGTLVPGKGITVKKLEKAGVLCIDEEEAKEILQKLETEKHA